MLTKIEFSASQRQEYLYRELLKLEPKFPNIRLARKRFSSIWGGASLLQMLLSCMEYLLYESGWQWDFVLNLSESDFPLKTVDQLVTFLTANRGQNFVRNHGREVQRFIQKQGLDMTFVECDRKINPIYDQMIVLMIEEYAYGKYPSGVPNLNAYWQSVYHHEDAKHEARMSSVLNVAHVVVRSGKITS